LEETKRLAEEFNKSIIQSTSDWIWEINAKGQYTYCSAKVENILGYTADEIIGKSPYDFMSKEEGNRIRAIFEGHVKKKSAIVDLENCNIHKDGHQIYLLTNGSPVLDENGNLKAFRGADKDITERKNIEKMLKESEEKYLAILDYSTDQIFMIDNNFKYIFVSNSLAASLGKKHEEMVNKTIKEIHGDTEQTERFTNNIMLVLKNKESINIEEPLVIAGKKSFINSQLSPVKNDSGEVTRVLGIMRDITENKAAEEELKRSGELLQSKIADLERFNKLTIGRELKMIELKTKIKALEEQLTKMHKA
jgi:PAS domain S-box-containing protein